MNNIYLNESKKKSKKCDIIVFENIHNMQNYRNQYLSKHVCAVNLQNVLNCM